MKNRILLVIVFAVLSLTAFAQQKKVAVFVTSTNPKGTENNQINKFIGDELVTIFSKNGKYIAVERTASFLEVVKKEQQYQQTGAVNDNELSRLGKQFGVQIVCVVEISTVFDKKHISARLIDVETAEVINSSTENSPLGTIEDLQKVCKKIGEELLGPTVQEKAAAALQKEKEQAEEKKRLEQAVKDGYMQTDNIMFVVTNSAPKMTFKRAEEAAKECRLGGYSDWRLPTTSEITRIIDLTEMYKSIYDGFPTREYEYGCANNYYYNTGHQYVGKGWRDSGKSCVFVRDVSSK